MIISINQPAYIPWLGYLERIRLSDVHVVLDHVSMGKDGMANRNKILTPDGVKILTIPICGRGDDTPISRIKIADNKWQNKHWELLRASYKNAPFWKIHADFFEDLYKNKFVSLSTPIELITHYMLDAWGIKTKMLYTTLEDSKFREGTKSDLNLNICHALHATRYLSGPMGKDYLNMDSFARSGVRVEFHDYRHPTYPQQSSPFTPYLSAVDALFNTKEFPCQEF